MRHESIGDVAEHLLHYVEEGKTYQSDKILSIPATNYTDARLWAREIDVIFKRVPLMLALTAELPNPGDFKTMDVLDVPIILSRDKSGAVHALLNVCVHRGGPVAVESKGHCARFYCKYHAWSYGLDGKLVAIADQKKFGEIDKTRLALKSLPCAEKAGMIFVVLTPGEGIDIESYYGDALRDLEDMGLEGWHVIGARTIHGANWKIALDGYFEGYHIAAVHPVSVNPYVYTNVNHYESFGPHMRIAFAAKGIENIRAQPRETWFSTEGESFSFVRHLFPNVEVFNGRGIVQVAQIFPGPRPDSNVTVLTYLRKDPPRDEADRALIDQTVKVLSDAVFEEDYSLGVHIQKGLEAGGLDAIRFGKNERGNQFFHEVIQWYLDGKTGPMPKIE